MIQSCVEGQQTLKLKLNDPDVKRGHDSYGFVAADIRFAETTQCLPDTLANSGVDEKSALIRVYREMASLILADPDLSSPSFPFSSPFALFTQSVINCQPVHLSILVPCSPCSVGLA